MHISFPSPMPARRSESAFIPEGNFFGSACSLPSTPLSLVDQPSVATNTPVKFTRAPAAGSRTRSFLCMMIWYMEKPSFSRSISQERQSKAARWPLGSSRAEERTVQHNQIVPKLAEGKVVQEACCLKYELLIDVRTERSPCVEPHLQRTYAEVRQAKPRMMNTVLCRTSRAQAVKRKLFISLPSTTEVSGTHRGCLC